jgi:hypothetical protein
MDGAGTVDIMAGVRAYANYRSAGTVGLNAGVYIDSQAGVAGAGKDYGIYNLNQSNWTGSPFSSFNAYTQSWMSLRQNSVAIKDPVPSAGSYDYTEYTTAIPGQNCLGSGAVVFSYHPTNLVAQITAFEGDASHNGAGTVTRLAGLAGYVEVGAGSGQVTYAAALFASRATNGGGTMLLNAGVYIDSQAGVNGTDVDFGIYDLNQANWFGPAKSSLSGFAQGFFPAGVLGQTNFVSLNPTGSGAGAVNVVLEDNTTRPGSAVYGAMIDNLTAGTRPLSAGIEGDLYLRSNADFTRAFGVLGYADKEGTGTVALLAGVDGSASISLGTASVMAALVGSTNVRNAGTVTLNAGLYLQSQAGVGTANFGIYNLNAQNWHGPALSTFSAAAMYWLSPTEQPAHVFASRNELTPSSFNSLNERTGSVDDYNNLVAGSSIAFASWNAGVGLNSQAVGFEGGVLASHTGCKIAYVAAVDGFIEVAPTATGNIGTLAVLRAWRVTNGGSGTIDLNTGLYLDSQASVAGTGKDFGIYNLNQFNYTGPDPASFTDPTDMQYVKGTKFTSRDVGVDSGALNTYAEQTVALAGTAWASYNDLNIRHTTGTVTRARALEGNVYSYGAGDIGEMSAVVGYVQQSGAGNVTQFTGVYGVVGWNGAGTCTEMSALRAFTNIRSAGTVNLNAGVYIDDQSGVAGAGKDYQIYSESAVSYFGPPGSALPAHSASYVNTRNGMTLASLNGANDQSLLLTVAVSNDPSVMNDMFPVYFSAECTKTGGAAHFNYTNMVTADMYFGGDRNVASYHGYADFIEHAGSGTITALYHYEANGVTISGGGTITSETGFYSGVPAGTNKLSFHADGAPIGLKDGIAAPSTISGVAQLYVDTADGDLKVKFGDGTVKTIVVDT